MKETTAVRMQHNAIFCLARMCKDETFEMRK